VKVLINMAESTEEEEMGKALGELLKPYQGMILPRGREEQAQEERLGRVLRRVKEARNNPID
jgi:hypothetical protein